MKQSGVHDVMEGRKATTATLWQLSIVRGVTRFPDRPITHAEYLIGSSPICDLQLSAEFPEFCAVIASDHESVELFAASDRVRVRVNGRETKNDRLQPGDRIELNDVQMVLEQTVQPLRTSPRLSVVSAVELVDALERELDQLSEFESELEADRFALFMHEIDRLQQSVGEEGISTSQPGRSAA